MRPRTGNAGDVSHPDIMEVAKVSYGLLLVPIKVIGILFTTVRSQTRNPRLRKPLSCMRRH